MITLVTWYSVLMLGMTLSLFSSETKSDIRAVVAIAAPKCGTNLLQKCLWLIAQKDAAQSGCAFLPGTSDDYGPAKIPSLEIRTGIKKILHTIEQQPKKLYLNCCHPFADEMKHLIFKKSYSTILHNPHIAVFLMTRDPRDQCVSYAYWRKAVYPSLSRRLSIDKLIVDSIMKGSYRGLHVWRHDIVAFYQLYLPWLNLDNVMHVTFESLVGPQGGGSRHDQIKEIQKIAHHAGVVLSNHDTEEIAQQLFGQTSTFREGKIGSWKKEFTQKAMNAFKNNTAALKLLIDLGYEKNSSWCL